MSLHCKNAAKLNCFQDNVGYNVIDKKLQNSSVSLIHCAQYTLRPESSENILILLQGADLYFSNQNDLRNPKMGSKQSVVVLTQ